MSARHWSDLPEHTSTWGIGVLLAAFRLGGRVLFFASLWPVVVFFWLCLPNVRRASWGYQVRLARFCHRAKPAPWASFAHMWRFADTILDKLLAVSGFFTPQSLRVEGAQALANDPRGAVLVTAHTGCPELCQVLAEQCQDAAARHVHVLVHTVHAERFNALLHRLNPHFSLHHTEVSRITPQTAIALSEFIAQGHWVVIVADRTPIHSSSVCPVSFLGADAPVALGPFVLAHLLECPVWSMICTRETQPESTARYRVRFTHLSEPVKVARSARAAHLNHVAQLWARSLESMIVESPLDWFNFFDFWQPAASSAHLKQSTQT